MPTRCLIIGPEVGATMGKGGGCKVAVKMAETLAENGFEVGLSAFKGYPIWSLDSIHGTHLTKWENKVRTYYLFDVKSKSDDQKIKGLSGLFPLHIGVIPFSIYVKYVIRKFNPRIVVCHDDVPLSTVEMLSERLVLLYVHFSYATRFKLGVGEIEEARGLLAKRCIKKFLDPLLKRLVLAENSPADLMIANSSLTAKYLKQTWKRDDIAILYPPIDTSFYTPSCEKENLVVSIGAIMPSKHFGDVIKALSMVRTECKLVIIGHYNDGAYYQKLLKLVKKLELHKRVTIMLDASLEQVIDTLSRAKALVHASRVEPFGIAVVEGMAAGCAPIVYKGATSGPWVDISNMGEFGLGFQTINELAKNIEEVMSDDNVFNYYSRKVRERSKSFDSSVFKKRFMEMLKTCL